MSTREGFLNIGRSDVRDMRDGSVHATSVRQVETLHPLDSRRQAVKPNHSFYVFRSLGSYHSRGLRRCKWIIRIL